MPQFLTALIALFVAQNFFRPKQHPPRTLKPNCLLTRHPVIFVHGVKSPFNFFDYWNGIIGYLKSHGYDVHAPKLAWRGPASRRLQKLRKEVLAKSQLTGKVHIIGHSLGGLDILDLTVLDQDISLLIRSITLVCTPLGGSPWARFAPPVSRFSDLRFRFGPKGVENRSHYRIPPTVEAGVVTASTPHVLAGAPVLTLHRLILNLLLRRSSSKRIENDGLVTLASQSQLNFSNLKTYWHFPGDHAQVIGAGPRPIVGKTAHECFLEHCIFLAELDLVSSK